jgi:hypothetical protein
MSRKMETAFTGLRDTNILARARDETQADGRKQERGLCGQHHRYAHQISAKGRPLEGSHIPGTGRRRPKCKLFSLIDLVGNRGKWLQHRGFLLLISSVWPEAEPTYNGQRH